jgi:stage II sporulation protein D
MSLPRLRFRGSCVSLLLVVALTSSCVRKNPTAEDAGDAERKTEKHTENAAEVDRALTEAATAALGDREGAVLVIDPHTGRLRAVVNPRLAFEQAFPPGSTIKSFTALTAMRAGLVDKETRTLCRGKFSGDGFEVICSHPKSKSPFNLAQALAYSCNYFFATMSGRLSFDAFKSTLASAGLGAKTGVNASGESAGKLGDGEWRVRNLLGEGENLLVTPIQLLSAYCALMNGGHLFRPQLSPSEGFVAEERSSFRIEPSQRAALIEGMRGAVVYGTAEKSELNKLPMFIFGKTGTSTSSSGFRRQGWFVSFAANARAAAETTPESLELAVLVFIKRSHGSDAAAVSQRIFDEYLKSRGGDETARAKEPDAGTRGEGPTLRVKLLSENRVVTVSLEDYVLGVLPVEAAVEDELEGLKAQAIVSRTFALKNMGRHSNEGFDLCSNTHCQQFGNDESRISEKMRRAVAATAGQVLRDASGQPADAYFHAACGGFTANFESLWGTPGPSYLRGVRDDYCATMPNHEWTDEIPATNLAKALAADPRTDAGRRIDEIAVTKRDLTGRAEIISIEGTRRRQVRGWEFKMIVGRALGWNVLKSSRFNVMKRGSMFIFRGSGFGHGLGLCQNGAHVMARRGGTFAEILNHYFPGARVSEGINAKGLNAKPQSRKAAKDDILSYSNAAALRLCVFALNPPLNAPQALSSEHFRINYAPGVSRPEVEAALRTLEAGRLDMFARVGPASLPFPDSAVDVVVHATTQAFVASTGQPWWVAGVTRDRRIELQPFGVLRSRRILTSTLRHEYAHSVIEAIGQGRAPRWLAEGLAIQFAGEGPMLLRFESNERLPVDELERKLAHPGSAAEMRSLYAAAYRAVRALIQKEGEPGAWRRVGAPSSLRSSAPPAVKNRMRIFTAERRGTQRIHCIEDVALRGRRAILLESLVSQRRNK